MQESNRPRVWGFLKTLKQTKLCQLTFASCKIQFFLFICHLVAWLVKIAQVDTVLTSLHLVILLVLQISTVISVVCGAYKSLHAHWPIHDCHFGCSSVLSFFHISPGLFLLHLSTGAYKCQCSQCCFLAIAASFPQNVTCVYSSSRSYALVYFVLFLRFHDCRSMVYTSESLGRSWSGTRRRYHIAVRIW